MKKLYLLCQLSFLFSVINAQNSNVNNFLFPTIGNKFQPPITGIQNIKKSGIEKTQIVKSINVVTAGSLNNLLTSSEKKTITDLTITGRLDARDFKILRDSMVNLTALDISAVTIQSYTGNDGTSYYYITYPANQIPESAFYISAEAPGIVTSSLTSIILPSNATSLGDMAFTFCTSLTSISISSSVTKIGLIAFVGCSATINVNPANPNYSSVDGVLFDKAKTTLIQFPLYKTGNYDVPSTVNSINMYGFCFCDKLTSVNIPTSVNSIGLFAFTSCSAIINVDTNNPNYTSLDGVLFNKSMSKLIQSGTSKSGSYSIPSSVDSIGDNAFYNCNLMTAVSIPSSVVSIADYAFYNCSGLTSITVNSLPISLANKKDVFFNQNVNTCILNVPFGTKSLYQSASGWSSFTHIIENIHGLILVTNSLILSSVAGSNNTVKISTNDPWTAVSNQSWLQVSPQSGSGNNTITVTAEANSTSDNRTAKVTVSVEGIQPQILTIIQTGLPKTINITAGGLSASLTAAELNSILNLKITGTIDARDFKTMRDQMPKLSYLDISEAIIAEYNGNAGTYSWITAYPANRIPDYAFRVDSGSKQLTLAAIKLPSTITAIGDYAFFSCQALTEIVIPNSVTSIGKGGFSSCYNLINVVLPNQLTSIESQVFSDCGFSSITIPNTVKTIASYGFGFCNKLKSLVIPNSVTNIENAAFMGCSALTDLIIGSSVTFIDSHVFYSCTNLASVVIPNSVTRLGDFAFSSCSNLKTIQLSDSLATIGNYCFYLCNNLTEIAIPNSVKSIGEYVFNSCKGLKSVTVNSDIPVDLSSSNSVFTGVDMTTCILNVPFGAKSAYAVDYQWKDFVNIRSNIHGFTLSTNSLNLLSAAESNASVSIKSNDSWITSSNQTWLKVSPNTGTGNDTLRLTADANASSLKRTAIVTVTAGMISKTIAVIQAASPKTITITAGRLVAALTTSELSTISNLTITGTINARDFKIMRDSMPNLEIVDLSTASIVAYSGNLGTGAIYTNTYPVNEIPIYAFYNSNTYTAKIQLKKISLPASATSIGYSSFQRCTGLSDIKISNSLKSIASNSFEYCSGLTDLIIPDSVITIGSYSFASCAKLKTVILGKSLEIIGDYAFENCSSLCNIVMPNSLKTIGLQSFQYTAMTKLIIPESVTSIGSYAFDYCKDLIEVVLPNSLTIISDNTFNYCFALKKITFGNKLTTIRSGAFLGCSGLASIVIPESVTSIGSSTFMNCSGLLSITANPLIPVDLSNNQTVFDGVDKTLCTLNVPYQAKSLYATANQWKDFVHIAENPYGLRIDLNEARLSSKAGSSVGVNVISNTDWKALSNQSWLSVNSDAGSGNKLITLTADKNISSTTRIAQVTVSAIGLPDKTITITQAAAAKTVQVTAGGLFSSLTSTELNTVSNLILTGTIDARDFKTMRDNMPILSDVDLSQTTIATYTGSNGTGGTNSISYPANSVPQYAFYNINTYSHNLVLRTIELPTNITSIGNGAFEYCDILDSINIPNSVTSIGDVAFAYCIGLRRFVLPNSVTALGSYVFQNCTALTDFTFGNSIASTGNWTFSNCTLLKNVILYNSMRTIGVSAFQSCSNLTNITFGNSLTTIGSSAFSTCSKLDNIVIPNTVTTLEYSTFMYCKSLKNITLSNSLTTIGSSAFSNCIGLTDIVIPNSVTSIGEAAFSSCSALRNVKFSNTLKTIENSAFSSCIGLVDIVIPNSVNTIGYLAFRDCSGMKSITIPAGISKLGFSSIGCYNLNKIYSLAPVPISLSDYDVFYSVNKSTCLLYVPSGSKALYQAAAQWKDFTNIIEITTAIPALTESSIKIYPNPMKETFRIGGLNEKANLSVSDINGKVLLNKQIRGNEPISGDGLPQGLYFVRIATSSGTVERKMIKK